MTQILTFGPDDTPLQHSPGWIGDNNCYIHGYEPIPPNPYRVCFECGHCYTTKDNLRAAYRRAVEAMCEYASNIMGMEVDPLVIPPAEEISFCQECIHDF